MMRARGHGPGFWNAGFSLVELAVVIVVMGILISAAVPDIARSNRRRRVEAAANDLASRVGLARQRTIATRIPSRLVLDADEGIYRIERQQNDSTWARDPDEDYILPTGVEWVYSAGGDSSSNNDVVFESRGTVLQEDAPLSVVFENDGGDIYHLSLVRTGRLAVRCGLPPE
jgi:prepilin-type N-terminal cleavage/methylation domain-containing protein